METVFLVYYGISSFKSAVGLNGLNCMSECQCICTIVRSQKQCSERREGKCPPLQFLSAAAASVRLRQAEHAWHFRIR